MLWLLSILWSILVILSLGIRLSPGSLPPCHVTLIFSFHPSAFPPAAVFLHFLEWMTGCLLWNVTFSSRTATAAAKLLLGASYSDRICFDSRPIRMTSGRVCRLGVSIGKRGGFRLNLRPVKHPPWNVVTNRIKKGKYVKWKVERRGCISSASQILVFYSLVVQEEKA